jgi:uncharacterized Zn-binding protein involved in type VI secretion
MNVMIGMLPAWRGIPLAAVAGLSAAKAVSDTAIKVAEAATVAAAGTPAAPAAKAAEELAKSTAAAAMGSMISGLAGGMSDIHTCATPLPIPPHGPGVVITGSPTVMINNMPACRMGDTILEAVGPPNSIVKGQMNVIIGDMAVPALASMLPEINPLDGTVNCGNIIDAVIDRLTGNDPNASAPVDRDGSFSAIEDRHKTDIAWGGTFDDAFKAVKDGGDGTIAIVGIKYAGGGSHVVVLANKDGQVGIVEGQHWSNDSPKEVITSPKRANERYSPGGDSTVGYGIVGSRGD